MAVADKMSPWNYRDKALGLPMGLLMAPVDIRVSGGDRQVSGLFFVCIMSMGTQMMEEEMPSLSHRL